MPVVPRSFIQLSRFGILQNVAQIVLSNRLNHCDDIFPVSDIHYLRGDTVGDLHCFLDLLPPDITRGEAAKTVNCRGRELRLEIRSRARRSCGCVHAVALSPILTTVMLTDFSDDFKIIFGTQRNSSPLAVDFICSIPEGEGITGSLCAGKPCPVPRSPSAMNQHGPAK
jgi:hypothetical protein